ncbi:sulfur carrier protein ThiS [Agitococcus lubricus]|uniref:Sulfur carrier protein ThiS n=1 Tax=Agitococcus lubricus TaxID=1077255 RepID=A0A2T5IZN0_9GAMM|nr:sulfur carrier protein ThiS [Agitococcus lubricus]PTQ89401.1 sulfur carrier protein ThiS [Agitococcus lubricus]
MQVLVNGESKEYADNTTIADVIHTLGLEGRRIAVELNQDIVPKSQHAHCLLQAGDRLEIVHAIGGG